MALSCSLCTMDPGTHSFEKVGTNHGIHVFYTCFGKAKDYSNKAAIERHIYGELAKIDMSSPWIWVFNCDGFNMKHAMQIHVAMGLAQLIKREFSERLQQVIILNSGSVTEGLINQILPLFDRSSLSILHSLRGSPLEIYMALKRLGWDECGIRAVIELIKR